MLYFFLANKKFMIRERIQALVEALGISGREFCKSIGKSNSWNRTIGKNIGTDIVVKILRTYPQVNINWLVLGEGDIFIENTPNELRKSSPNLYFNKNLENLLEDLRLDNKDLREENKKLRETLLELMYKNEKLMVENVRLIAKSLEESEPNHQ